MYAYRIYALNTLDFNVTYTGGRIYRKGNEYMLIEYMNWTLDRF
jgi:hypothetical protein